MMEDLLDFRTFKETLGTNGFRDIKVSENSICCKAIICEHTIGLKGVLPETFPYEFPTIYIDEQSYANISPLPHIGSDFDICTFDMVQNSFRFLWMNGMSQQVRSLLWENI